MSAICNCKFPKIRQEKALRTGQNVKKAFVCDTCGNWWDPRHGSKPEATPGTLMIPRGRPGSGKARAPKPTRRIVQ